MQSQITVGKRLFSLDADCFYLMGILNTTPDSFSDGGQFLSRDAALMHTKSMIDCGADIIDIGGESTRPGHTPVSAEEEIARTAPIIESIKAEFEIPVSIDTSKSTVALAAIAAGADLVNDVWGLKADPLMAAVIAEYEIPCVLMHNRPNTSYTDFLAEVRADLEESIAIAADAGIAASRIILDPGIGFAKTHEQNLFLLRHLECITEMGYPTLLGISRKSVIGNTLHLAPDEREEGTIALNLAGYAKGMQFFRVHDIEKNRRALTMIQAIRKAGV